jgi:hypothetical protein
MSTSDWYAGCYTEARNKFLNAAACVQMEVNSHVYAGAKTPDGDGLYLDIGAFGPATPKRAMVVISGTHGVEGFCGSACQTAWLASQYQHRHLEETAVYFIHGLNPYGFAWNRRVTPENVDLNRNFLDFKANLPINPGYANLERLLNPTELDINELESLPPELISRLQTAEAVAAFKAAVGQGQYDCPSGIIFGGREPTQCNWMLRQFVASLPPTIRVGVVLDFHTGLGPPGALEILSEEMGPKFAALSRWFAGRKVTTLGDEASLGYRIEGSVYRAFTSPNSSTPWHCAALEFGTQPLPLVLAALRADNWLHCFSGGGSRVAGSVRDLMKRAFAVPAEHQDAVLNIGLAVIDEALRGLYKA